MPGKKGMIHKRKRAKKQTDAIEATKIENILADHYRGDSKLSITQLRAIELRYARLKPVLSAVEQTIIDPRDKADPSELQAKLRALYESNPELFESFLPLRSAPNEQITHSPPDAVQ